MTELDELPDFITGKVTHYPYGNYSKVHRDPSSMPRLRQSSEQPRRRSPDRNLRRQQIHRGRQRRPIRDHRKQ
ncbi:hypothetical protein [Arthrobacter sp. H14-L1]|uniref:hypothetical protein n=1 Tax=Arthrobacter sp. H14-L1 TaxID=2996697 RepID=UPI00226EC6F1|nr:hypothetical protein [Arthrobacter sp. H14-L1]